MAATAALTDVTKGTSDVGVSLEVAAGWADVKGEVMEVWGLAACSCWDTSACIGASSTDCRMVSTEVSVVLCSLEIFLTSFFSLLLFLVSFLASFLESFLLSFFFLSFLLSFFFSFLLFLSFLPDPSLLSLEVSCEETSASPEKKCN